MLKVVMKMYLNNNKFPAVQSRNSTQTKQQNYQHKCRLGNRPSRPPVNPASDYMR